MHSSKWMARLRLRHLFPLSLSLSPRPPHPCPQRRHAATIPPRLWRLRSISTNGGGAYPQTVRAAFCGDTVPTIPPVAYHHAGQGIRPRSWLCRCARQKKEQNSTVGELARGGGLGDPMCRAQHTLWQRVRQMWLGCIGWSGICAVCPPASPPPRFHASPPHTPHPPRALIGLRADQGEELAAPRLAT